MATAAKLNSRYEQLEVIGEGGMGVVYRAYDSFLRREVTLKTVRDIQDQAALELFKREVNVLSGISHPNIVEVFDVGEIVEPMGKRPYFVMPLLRGVTLDKLIKSSSQRLTVSRCIDIMSQVCRGLQAAHDAGLVHRDLKPSNLFILEDDSVKIIDFGIAHLVDAHSTAGMKGTLLYMSPEQILLKRPSPLSDVFAAAVVCFVALTRRHPFEGASGEEIADAIVNRIPAPASDFNPAVGQSLSQVIHKAMAKQPFQRFGSAREFSENLQKALRNEPIEWFNPDRIEARIQRAKKAFDEGQLGIASDIVSELEAEASLHKDIGELRKQIDHAHRERTITQLLDTARRCYEGQEYQLALQKVQDVLNLDNTNTEARSLQGEIENKRSSDQIADWCRIALQHLENHAYGHARDALQNVLKLRPKETRAQQMMLEVDRREQEYIRVRQEKEQFYQAALNAMQMGELSSALTKLERVLDMDRRAPETFAPDRAAMYQKLYNEVRSQHDLVDRGYAEAKRHVDSGNYQAALAICTEFLEKYPQHAIFQSLLLDAEDRQRQEISANVARVSREVETEPDLSRRIVMLEEALQKHPDEPQFTRAIHNNRTKRDLVESIVAKARGYENGGQYSEALDQWRILRDIYRQYPGLEFEADRVQKRKLQKERAEAKGRWVEQIDQKLSASDFTRAVELCGTALAEFPNDPELIALEKTSQQGMLRMVESERLLAEARSELEHSNRPKALELLRQALQMQPSSAAVRAALLDALTADAREKLEHDWRAAEEPIQEITSLDPGNARAKSLRTLIHDRKQEEYVADALSRARELKESGNSEAALGVLDEALATYPRNAQLVQRRVAIENSIQAAHRQQTHQEDLVNAQQLFQKAEQESDPQALRGIYDATRVLADRYPEDAAFQTLLFDVKTRLDSRARPPEVPLVPKPAPPAKSDANQRSVQGSEAVVPKGSSSIGQMAGKMSGLMRSAGESFKGQARTAGPSKARMKQFAGIAAGIIVALFIAAIYSVVRDRADNKAPTPTANSGRLELKLDPADAQLEIFSKDRKLITTDREQMPFGEYVVRVSAPGYQPEERQINFKDSTSLAIALRPLSQAFELFSDVEGLNVTLDGQALTAATGNQFVANDLSEEQQHTLTMNTPSGTRANLVFVSKKGAMPEVVEFTTDRMIRAVAVSSYGGSAKMTKPAGTREKVLVAWNGEPAEEILDDGLTRTGLAPQEHALTLLHGNDRREQTIKINPSPKLAVFVSDLNLGTLIVDVGYQDVVVEVNDKQRQARKAQGNRLAMGLEPKEYRVRISKAGFYPEEQKLTIKKGETYTLKAALREIANHGTLIVKRGAGVEVAVGDARAQTVSGDGDFNLQAPLGRQVIRVRKNGYRPWEETREFQPDKTEVLDVGDIKLQALEASVSFKVTPPDARVRLVGADGKDIALTGRTASLREGKYQAIATAGPDYDPKTVSFDVTGGRNRDVEITLDKKVDTAAKPIAPPVGPMDGWKPEDWKLGDGGWHYRTRNGRALYTGRPTGMFTFGVLSKGSMFRGNRFRILFDYRGPQEFHEFEIQKDKVVITKRKGGREIFQRSKTHRIRMSDSMRVRIVVTASAATLSLANGADWVEVYAYQSEEGGLDKGQFGLDGVEAIVDFRRQ